VLITQSLITDFEVIPQANGASRILWDDEDIADALSGTVVLAVITSQTPEEDDQGGQVMTKVAIYARPSAPGETVEAQLSKLRIVAEQRELSVVADYFDMAIGMDRRRTGLGQLLRDARHRKFEILLVDSFDRIAWSVPNLRELMDVLGKNEIRVISVRDHFDSGASLSGQSVLTASILHKLEGRLGRERFHFGIRVASKNQTHQCGLTLDDVESL
jgi:predicted site-specific integrase-resolvase